MTGLRAFHSDPAVKQKYLDRVAAHRAADQLVRGVVWDGGEGSAIGCTLDAYDHSRYPVELGLPEWLAHLKDRIYVGLSNARAMEWPTELLAAIPVGAVIADQVRYELAARRLERLLPALDVGTQHYAKQCGDALRGCIVWLRSGAPKDTGESVYSAVDAAASSATCSAVCSAARAAAHTVFSVYSTRLGAYSTAYSACLGANAAAGLAAYSTARSVASSTAYSAHWKWEANAATGSAAYSTAYSAHWEWEADTLLELLRGSHD